MRVISLQQAQQRYGQIDGSVWPTASAWQVKYIVPSLISEHMINSATGKPCVDIFVNSDMVSALDRAFMAVIANGLEKELETFDGCGCVRSVRGFPNELSCHAYSLGLDFNAKNNPLGDHGTMNPDLVKCFTAAGFAWGGNFKKRKDPMHFSYGWEG